MNRKSSRVGGVPRLPLGGTGLLWLLPEGDAAIGPGILLIALLIASPLLAWQALEEIEGSNERGRALALATLAISGLLIAVAIMMLFLPLFYRSCDRYVRVTFPERWPSPRPSV
jgi:hypothetical protein